MIIKSPLVSKRFIPEWNGNKEQPSHEQVCIVFRSIPGAADKSNYIGFKSDQGGGFQLIYNDALLVRTYVEKVENLTLEVGDKTEKISDGIKLASCTAPILSELFTEIREYLFPKEDIDEGESEA